MSCAPDVGVGGIGLLGAVSIGEVADLEPLAHLFSAAEFRDKGFVEPRLVDSEVGVGEQAVAVETLDVVSFVGASVAPDADAVFGHGLDEEGSSYGAADGGGVEVGLPCARDMECAALEGEETFADHFGPAVDKPGFFSTVLLGSAGDAFDVGFVILTEEAGVAVRDGTFFAHPCDCA